MSERRKLTAAERQQIYEKFGGRCAYCGCEITIKEMQADQLIFSASCISSSAESSGILPISLR